MGNFEDRIWLTGATYYNLAEAVGFGGVIMQALTYPLHRAEETGRNIPQLLGAEGADAEVGGEHRDGQRGDAGTVSTKATPRSNAEEESPCSKRKKAIDNASRSLQHMENIHPRMEARIFLSGLLGNGFQLQIQVSFLGMSMASRKVHDNTLPEIETGVAIVAALLMSGQVFLSLLEQHRAYEEERRIFSAIFKALEEEEEDRPNLKKEKRWWQKLCVSWKECCGKKRRRSDADCTLQDLHRALVRDWQRRALCWFLFGLFSLNLVWVSIEIWALFNCDSHLYNMISGCVDLSSFDCFKDPKYDPEAHPGCHWEDPCCAWKPHHQL
eukprot:NODE_1482_length_1129_cov_395.286778.p1 GENE.NODE_1482_length_1129_cov_395.286778~~NODE_1482_length_1129_cov_395.286778.p1  ORF type:complete len:326 (-),score=76.11 NODE_1482_length_1129_cov_395.286778:134-1111(-)